MAGAGRRSTTRRWPGCGTARARAREVAWAQAAETGRLPSSTVAGFTIPGLVLDLDATIVVCHSEKESAAKTWKKTFGYHPLLCFLDATGEALAGMLRPGNAGSNTAADHITVLDQALAQIPDEHRHGTDILIRCDSAGASHAFLAHIRSLREHGVRTLLLRRCRDHRTRSGPRSPPAWTGCPPSTPTGHCATAPRSPRLTHLVDLSAYPDGTRMIVRRERPHPGAQLSLFDTIEGLRHQVFVTDTPRGRLLAAAARAAPPRPRPRRGPHPHRQGHRLRPVPVPPCSPSTRLARTRPDRHRPARLDPNPAAGRRTRPGRAEEAALPAPARRRPHRAHRPPNTHDAGMPASRARVSIRRPSVTLVAKPTSPRGRQP